MLIDGGLVVTISPNQEPEAYADPVDGNVVLDLDDDLRVFMTLDQAGALWGALNSVLDSDVQSTPHEDDRDPTVNELLDRGEV